MRYVPYDHEYRAATFMTEGELMEYFLTRVFETEEVWALEDKADWVVREQQGQSRMPVWPYRKFAVEVAIKDWSHCLPQAESLEVFLQDTLDMLIEDDVMMEIMPTTDRQGCIVSPQRLKSILEGMMDAGEYTLDG